MSEKPTGWVNTRLNYYLKKGRVHNFMTIEEIHKTLFPNYDIGGTRRQINIYVKAGYAKKRRDKKYRFLKNRYPIPSMKRVIKEDMSMILDKFLEEERASFSIKDIKSKLHYDVSEQMIGRLLDKRLFPRISRRHFSIIPYKKLKEEKPVYYIPISQEPEYHTKGHIIVEVLRRDEKKIILQPDEIADVIEAMFEVNKIFGTEKREE